VAGVPIQAILSSGRKQLFEVPVELTDRFGISAEQFLGQLKVNFGVHQSK
jgi:hypothetical protein